MSVEEKHYRVVRLWIRRCVIENTTIEETPSMRSQHQLLRYLSAGDTCSICFDEICRRILDDKTSNRAQTINVLSLLKRQVPQHANDRQSLRILLSFCDKVVPGAADVHQSLSFLHCLVISKMKSLGLSITAVADRSAIKTDRRRSQVSASMMNHPISADPQHANSNHHNHYLVGSLMSIKLLTHSQSKSKQAFKQIPLKHYNPGVAAITDDDDDNFISIDIYKAPVSDRIQIIRDFKAQSLQVNRRQGNFIKVSRKSPTVKCYQQQTPLTLPKDDIRKLLYVIIHEDAHGHEKRMIASKLFIKYVMDQWGSQHLSESDWFSQCKYIFELMLIIVGNEDSQAHIHMLNLIFNLSMHLHLITQEYNTFETLPSMHITRRCLSLIWQHTCDILLALYHSNQTDGSLWFNALNLILFFTSKQSRLDFNKLGDLDPRVIICIVQHSNSCLNQEYLRIVINLLMNTISTFSNDHTRVSLNIERLLAVISINDIIDLYCSVGSNQSRQNLFLIIFNHIVNKLQSHQSAQVREQLSKQAAILLNILHITKCPITFHKLFMYHLADDEMKVMRTFITNEKRKHKGGKGNTLRGATTSNSKRSNKQLTQLDTSFVNDFFSTLVQLSDSYLSLNSELETLKTEMLNDPPSLSKYVDTLSDLLHSANGDNRRYGCNWLCDLMNILYNDKLRKMDGGVQPSPRRRTSAKGRLKDCQFQGKGKGKGRPSSGVRPPRSPRGAPVSFSLPETTTSPRSQSTSPRGSPRKIVGSPRKPKSLGKRAATKITDGSLTFGLAFPMSEKTMSKIETLVSDVHRSLLTSPNIAVRRLYFRVIRQLVMYLRGHVSRIGVQPSVAICTDILNSEIANCIAADERDPSILTDMAEIILEFITVDTIKRHSVDDNDQASSIGNEHQPEIDYITRHQNLDSSDDSIFGRFLCGSIMIVRSLMMSLSLDPLLYLFRYLPTSQSHSLIREVAIIMITAHCDPTHPRGANNFEEAGGMLFFKSLLDSPNANIGFHVSRFLSKYLQHVDPVNYQKELKKLLTIIPEDKIAVDFFHVLGLLGDRTYLTVRATPPGNVPSSGTLGRKASGVGTLGRIGSKGSQRAKRNHTSVPSASVYHK